MMNRSVSTGLNQFNLIMIGSPRTVPDTLLLLADVVHFNPSSEKMIDKSSESP